LEINANFLSNFFIKKIYITRHARPDSPTQPGRKAKKIKQERDNARFVVLIEDLKVLSSFD